MKKTILTFLLIHSISLLVSQNNRRMAPEGTVKRDKHAKETSSPVMDTNNWAQLNALAQKAYTPDQAARMPLYKIKQVNYLYSDSYKIMSTNGCKVNTDEINFSEIFPKRSETEVTIVPLTTKDGCNYSCELLPIERIQKEFNKIENENK